MSSMVSLVALLCCLATCTSASASSSSLLRTRQLSSSSPQQSQRQTTSSSDPTSGYALYTLPPFTVTFTSSYSTTGLPTDPEERDQLLLATLHQPLQLITGEFLLESFRIEIAMHQEPSRNATSHDVRLQAVLDSFMTLDLQVAVRSSQHLSWTESGTDGHRYRHLQEQDATRDYEESAISSHSAPGNDLIQVLPAEDEEETAVTSSVHSAGAPRDNTPKTDLLQFEADFFTTAAFLEVNMDLNNEEDGSNFNEEVVQLMGRWISDSFDHDLNIYHNRLINSETGVLRHMEHIHIETDSDATYDPYTIGTAPDIPDASSPTSTAEDINANAPSTHTTPIGAWSKSEKLFFTILVSVSLVSIAGLLLALKKYKRRGRDLDRILEDHQHALHDDEFAFADPRACISGRHSDEIMDILNASDRYLATHRPDLLEAEQRSAIVPVATNNDDPHRPTERRYVTATNPFSYLYGASYFHSEKQAVEKDRARNAIDPMAGVELQEAVPDDEDLDLVNKAACVTDQTVSGYLQAWFQGVVGTRAAANAYKDEECYEYDDDEEELEVEELEEGQEVAMACDEDPSGYAFAYQDFPRQDGTPCLIYEETLDEEQEEEYLKNSQRNSLHSTTSYGVHDPLTDDEFRRALSQRSLLDIHSNSSSFEQHDACDDSEAQEHPDDEETNFSVSEVDSDEADPAKFTDKLAKMVAMRHRHYEKQKIVEKHREQRRQERARQRAEQKHQQQEEMQKRDRLLRRHSLELDIQELEANIGTGASGPPSSASKVITPPSLEQQNSWQEPERDLRQLQKPNLHRRTSSEADVGLAAPVMAAASAGVGIQTNRSMDLEESAVFSPTGNDMTTKSAPFNARLVQSARKAPRPTTQSQYDGVFRNVDRISPMSANSSSSNSVSSNHLPPMSVPKLNGIPVVSPASSFTDTGTDAAPGSVGNHSQASSTSSRSTPPLGMGSNSVRDGTSARRKKRLISSASAALAKGFQKRRSMSFSNVEEKKTEDDSFHNSSPDMSTTSSRGRQAMTAEPQHQRSNSVNRHRRSNSSSPADVMVHGIYAQFV